MFTRALARRPGPDLVRGLADPATAAALGTPDLARALKQHAAYVAALEALGVAVTVLPPLSGYPDACFVEDTAVIAADLAVTTSPGAPSRQGEEDSVAAALADMLPHAARIEPPATLDGGDVLLMDGCFFIGLSGRTNQAGAEALGRLVQTRGFTWRTIPVDQGLHLKSSVNWIAGDDLLATRELADHPAFAGYRVHVVDDAERYAANCLRINRGVLVPDGYPKTLDLVRPVIEGHGLEVVVVDVGEFAKVDGGLSCLSLRL